MAFGRHLKTYGIYEGGSHFGPLVQRLGTHFVSAYFPSTYLFTFAASFVVLELKMIPQRESSLISEGLQRRPFPSKAATIRHHEVQERSRGLESLPKGIPESKKRPKNGEVWEILSSTLG